MSVPDFTVCVGYDSREAPAVYTCVHSMLRRASKPPAVKLLMLDQLDAWVKRDEKASTEFSLSRFLTPYLAPNNSISMFVDCDFLFLDDVWKLYEIARDNCYVDVLCAQHDYVPKNRTKFLGHEQHTYPRKNWSSLMIFNGHRTAVQRLTPEEIKKRTPAELHRMEWARDVGAIDLRWNWLVGEYEDRDPDELHALHFTLGGPWFGIESAYSQLWRDVHKEIVSDDNGTHRRCDEDPAIASSGGSAGAAVGQDRNIAAL